MTSFSIYLVIFFCLAYLIVTDKSVSQAFVYIFDLTKNKIVREIWWIKNNPANPIVKYLMWRRSMKLAKELRDKLDRKQ